MMTAMYTRRLALLAAITVFGVPLVYAGIADIDLSGVTRAAPPTMGALEVGGAQSGLPNAPVGIVLTRVTP